MLLPKNLRHEIFDRGEILQGFEMLGSANLGGTRT